MNLIEVRRSELPALGWAALWFFCVLSSYYLVRPVRETFSSELAQAERANLFTMTLVVMLLVTPLYGLVVSTLSRKWLVPMVYGFFVVNLLGFWSAMQIGWGSDWLPKVFFVWISVFNLFVVTLFWGTAVDLFSGEQGKRLFGLVFGAGTLGQLCSSLAVPTIAANLGTPGLVSGCALLLATGACCSWRLRNLFPHSAKNAPQRDSAEKNTWSASWQGMLAVVRSPFLLGIISFVVLASFAATVVYFQMTDLVAKKIPDSSDRTNWFASINAYQAAATLLSQTAVVGWLLRTLGVGMTLALLPTVLLAGFGVVAMTQSLMAIGFFQIALRTASFSLANPSLEVLFTSVAREQKYRAKAFIDTVGKRAGDVVGAQSYALLGTTLGWTVATFAWAMLPVAMFGIVLSWILGSAHDQAAVRAKTDESSRR